MKHKNSKRYGKFFLSREMIIKYPNTIKKIMGECIILRAENMWCKEGIEYEALSDWFDEVEEGFIIPRYDIIFRNDGKNVKWMFGYYNDLE